MTPALTEAEHRAQLRRAVIAATVGTTIEWYDFFLYGVITGLVFGKVFFPGSDPLVGTLNAFVIYAGGFAARPIGAAIFGHYGDRIGRKSTLIATLMFMGLATFAIAFVPGYDSIGVWGAVILSLLRLLQGIGVGGEWGGSVLLAMEWSRHNNQRGFIASWPQLGVPLGLFLANLAVLVMSRISGNGFAVWGWRVPFLISILLVGLGLWIRLGIAETPAFRKLEADQRIERAPVTEVLRRQPKEILLSALARMAEQAPFYIFTTFVFAYGTTTLHADRDLLLSGVLVASAMSFVLLPLAGAASDRIGRRRMYLIGVTATFVYGFIYFGLLDSRDPLLIFLAVMCSLLPHNLLYGPQAALIAESFTPRLRYSGASLGYQLASLIAGGPAPIIATFLFARYHSGLAIACYIAFNAAVSFVAVCLMPDHTGKDVSEEYDAA